MQDVTFCGTSVGGMCQFEAWLCVVDEEEGQVQVAETHLHSPSSRRGRRTCRWVEEGVSRGRAGLNEACGCALARTRPPEPFPAKGERALPLETLTATRPAARTGVGEERDEDDGGAGPDPSQGGGASRKDDERGGWGAPRGACGERAPHRGGSASDEEDPSISREVEDALIDVSESCGRGEVKGRKETREESERDLARAAAAPAGRAALALSQRRTLTANGTERTTL